MTDTRLSFLFSLYLNDEISKAQLDEFFNLVNNDENLEELNQLLEKNWIILSQNKQPFDFATKSRMLSNIYGSEHNQYPVKKVKLWPRIAIAAAMISFIIVGLLYFNQNTSLLLNQKIVKNNIVPGGNKAYLTLENGQKISLTDVANGNIANQNGITIIKNTDGSIEYKNSNVLQKTVNYNNIETPKGGQFSISLGDGSKVWLNAESSLKYPTTFEFTKIRKVELTGEAYFEVAKDMKPFIVVTGNQELQVLGTHFNINGYTEEEAIKTTLLEGSVRILNLSSKVSTFLKPNQQSLLNRKGINVSQVDAEESIAWKNGYFTFNNEELVSIMRKLSRWYDVEIDTSANPILMNKKFSGTISRYGNVSDVLGMLELTEVVHFKIVGRRIIITR